MQKFIVFNTDVPSELTRLIQEENKSGWTLVQFAVVPKRAYIENEYHLLFEDKPQIL